MAAATQSGPPHEVDAAVAEVRALGLVPHPDRPKNWDLSVALGTILERTTSDARVLEMGAAPYSPLLVWLFQYGYRRLCGIDLVAQPRGGPIRIEQMDLTQTRFPVAHFDAIACLSVIEHGVGPDAYFREAGRLLRPGGVLVTSTDFWADGVNTDGLTAYGGPVSVLDLAAASTLLAAAERTGFHPEAPVDHTCQERVVHWERTGLDFTFLVLTRIWPDRRSLAAKAMSAGRSALRRARRWRRRRNLVSG